MVIVYSVLSFRACRTTKLYSRSRVFALQPTYRTYTFLVIRIPSCQAATFATNGRHSPLLDRSVECKSCGTAAGAPWVARRKVCDWTLRLYTLAWLTALHSKFAPDHGINSASNGGLKRRAKKATNASVSTVGQRSRPHLQEFNLWANQRASICGVCRSPLRKRLKHNRRCRFNTRKLDSLWKSLKSFKTSPASMASLR